MDTQVLFTKQRITKNVPIKPRFINNKIDEYILESLNNKLSGKCCNEGYIKKNSIKIEKKSLGNISYGDSSNQIIYSVTFVCEICLPVIGNVYECIIENINKMGVIGFSQENNSKPIYVLIPRDYIGEDVKLSDLKEGDSIYTKVSGIRYKHNDSIIQVIGEIM